MGKIPPYCSGLRQLNSRQTPALDSEREKKDKRGKGKAVGKTKGIL